MLKGIFNSGINNLANKGPYIYLEDEKPDNSLSSKEESEEREWHMERIFHSFMSIYQEMDKIYGGSSFNVDFEYDGKKITIIDKEYKHLENKLQLCLDSCNPTAHHEKYGWWHYHKRPYYPISK